MVRYLVEEGGADVNWATMDDDSNSLFVGCHNENAGATPLLIACREGNVEVVRYLVIECKVDVNKATYFGVTPLRAAIDGAHWEVVGFLTMQFKPVYRRRR